MPPQHIYRPDLSRIHIEGFGFHWQQAAPTIRRWLKEHGIARGKIVDLGCGGGQWLAHLAARGYDVCGVDASPSMIRAARARVPAAQFITGSMADAKLPACDAVTSLGEPINYLDGSQSIRRTIRNVFEAIRPGGLFIFDARGPAPSSCPPRTGARLGDDWVCIYETEEDGRANSIVRHITTLVKHGNTYRRGLEVHRLKVYPRADMLRWLRAAGFTVRTFRTYGDYRLFPRQWAFLARKPA